MDFVPFTFIDLVDIVLVAALMYWLYRMTRGTNAPYILSGVVLIYLVWVIVRTLNMELLSSILGQVISVGVLALFIIFQPELRRFLQIIGSRQKSFNFLSRIFAAGEQEEVSIDKSAVAAIATACCEMAETCTGALIVIRQENDLQLTVEGGIAIDARISVPLLKNIFFKNAPLHDGAVVIGGNRVVAAKCILPVTQSNVPKEYGTRHRAAIGLSEASDAIIVIVSEETGWISIAQGGELRRHIEPQHLQQTIQRYVTRNTARRRRQQREAEAQTQKNKSK